jgi:hypothetical protein
VTIDTQQRLPPQPCARNRIGGALIVVGASGNCTRGALLVDRATV